MNSSTGRRLAALLVLATVAAAAAARASPAALFHAEGAEGVDATPGRALLELNEVTLPHISHPQHMPSIMFSFFLTPTMRRRPPRPPPPSSFLHLRLSPASTL